MSSDTSVPKPPDPRLNVDLFTEYSADNSGRTTPSSFAESPIGWGMSLVCGGVACSPIDNREALINYYNNATKAKQVDILTILSDDNKSKRLELFIESMMHQCALNFIKGHSNRNNSNSSLVIYSDIEHFNATNVIKDDSKKFKISTVHDQLKTISSQLIADNIITVCGALGLPYSVARLLINYPEYVYASFNSTFDGAIGNLDGKVKGPAMWVLYAIARQCFWSATSHVVDDLFIIEVTGSHSQDEDLDSILRDIGIKTSVANEVYGYRIEPLVDYEGPAQTIVVNAMVLVPDNDCINEKARELVQRANNQEFESKPEELQANLLQLAYWLLPYQEETDAILGLYKQTSSFVPNSNCIKGIQPFTLSSLTDKLRKEDLTKTRIAKDFPLAVNMKYHANCISTALRRTHRHLLRHASEKSWYINNIAQSNEQAAQMKKELLDLVFAIPASDWGDTNGWTEN